MYGDYFYVVYDNRLDLGFFKDLRSWFCWAVGLYYLGYSIVVVQGNSEFVYQRG